MLLIEQIMLLNETEDALYIWQKMLLHMELSDPDKSLFYLLAYGEAAMDHKEG